jgi:glycosyltransferase involved in cell wall biosynthesis
LINDEKYVISQAEINQRLLNIKPIVIIPARLNEGTKGLIRYFENLGSRRVNSVKFYILGEGDDRQIIEDYINENNLNVELCGHVAENEIIGYYKKANLFVLPSITDPSPLSIVEACFMHLPLLVSSRCGNHYEAVNETLNGKIFDPFNKESVQQTFDQIIDLKDKWYEMGEESFNISKLNFNNKKIIQNLIYSI